MEGLQSNLRHIAAYGNIRGGANQGTGTSQDRRIGYRNKHFGRADRQFSAHPHHRPCNEGSYAGVIHKSRKESCYKHDIANKHPFLTDPPD